MPPPTAASSTPWPWPGPHQTRVFYMGWRQLPVLAEQLRAAGLDDDTPAAWIVNGTCPQQQVSAGPWREVRQHPPQTPTSRRCW